MRPPAKALQDGTPAAPSWSRWCAGLAKRYPIGRGRDYVFRNFVHGKRFQRHLAALPDLLTTRRGFEMYGQSFDYVSDWIKLWGEFERPTERFVLEHLRGGETFLDVGSNVGFYTLLAAHQRSDVSAIAFEPNPTTADVLDRSVVHNGFENRIQVVRAAVADAEDELDFVIDATNSGRCRIATEPCAGARTLRVPVVTLDGWLDAHPLTERVSIVKIDVEGCEVRALRGMRRFLAEHRPALVVEAYDDTLRSYGNSRPELLRLVDEFGYREARPADGNIYLEPVEFPR